jgi:hypothetical protein
VEDPHRQPLADQPRRHRIHHTLRTSIVLVRRTVSCSMS